MNPIVPLNNLVPGNRYDIWNANAPGARSPVYNAARFVNTGNDGNPIIVWNERTGNQIPLDRNQFIFRTPGPAPAASPTAKASTGPSGSGKRKRTTKRKHNKKRKTHKH